ncbi:hypothetical protein L596_027007 [Steinernema carpocapsae]|uniref:Uncharacterized protein n=1 Tax=Steinernema carpocapsae TaxID=34508 RepID=A0A4U5M312_STECR|nr:hypothetical protein L596_027007 [Steinernema carpocapsae]
MNRFLLLIFALLASIVAEELQCYNANVLGKKPGRKRIIAQAQIEYSWGHEWYFCADVKVRVDGVVHKLTHFCVTKEHLFYDREAVIRNPNRVDFMEDRLVFYNESNDYLAIPFETVLNDIYAGSKDNNTLLIIGGKAYFADAFIISSNQLVQVPCVLKSKPNYEAIAFYVVYVPVALFVIFKTTALWRSFLRKTKPLFIEIDEAEELQKINEDRFPDLYDMRKHLPLPDSTGQDSEEPVTNPSRLSEKTASSTLTTKSKSQQ